MAPKSLRPLLFVVGILSVCLGIAGIVIPLLPTTPFFILAAFLFSKSSPRLHQRVLKLPQIGDFVAEWEQHGIIRPRAKFMCILLMSVASAIAIWMGNIPSWGIFGMLGMMLAVSAFVLSRPSKIS